jgi:hypothetical protein
MPRPARWPFLTGAAGLLLFAVALFLPGPPPKAADTVTTLARLVSAHQAAIVKGTPLAGVAFMALLWFAGMLSEWLRGQGRSLAAPPAPIAAAGLVIGSTLTFAGMLLFSGVAFRPSVSLAPAQTRAAVDTGNMFIESGKYGFALTILAASIGGRIALSRVMCQLGIVTAVVMVASTFPPFLDAAGIGQFGGGIDVFGALPGFLWLAALSIRLATAHEPDAAEAVPAPVAP